MSSDRTSEVPVLIVGAGPAGLITALALARHGVESVLVDRRTELSDLPRATVISTRSMEMLRSWGLEDAIVAGGVDVEWRLWMCETLARASEGSALIVGLPSRDESALVSPTAPACVPQDHLEPVLLDHVRSRRECRVELGTELVGVESTPDGVRAVLRAGTTGDSRVVHARYLVAADGAHSAARAALAVPMRGPDDLRHGVSAVFHAPLFDVVRECRYGIYGVTHPDARGTFLPAGRNDRWVYGVEWDPRRERVADFTESRMQRLIALGAGVADLEPHIERIGGFSFAAQMADTFRVESTFLVGDAAHRVTPRGGTGMNTAIHDGYDLGWKLAWVLRGWGRPELLDSYEVERRPAAQHNVTRSADPNGTVRAVGEELPVDLGGRIPHLWLPAGPRRVSTLDLLGPGLTLFTGPRRATWDFAASALDVRVPLAVRSLDPITARAMGIRDGGALLARPDGAPAGWWPPGAAAAGSLRAAVVSVLSGARQERASEAVAVNDRVVA